MLDCKRVGVVCRMNIRSAAYHLKTDFWNSCDSREQKLLISVALHLELNECFMDHASKFAV